MFDLKNILRKNIAELSAYSSARDEFKGEASIYLDANENPYDNGINRYPDPLQNKLKEKISNIKEVKPHSIFLGNGSDEAIDLIIRATCEPGLDNIVSISPTYGMYKVCADINNIEYREVLLNEDFTLNSKTLLEKADNHTKIIFLCSPNNPTGNSLAYDDIVYLLNNFNSLVVVDEAYIDFSEQKSLLEELSNYPNLIVLQTFSKAWGMAGIRLGMAFSSIEIIKILNKIKYPYNINILTQEKALEKLQQIDLKNNQVEELISERNRIVKALNDFPLIKHIYPSDANFVLVKVDNPGDVYNYLLEQKTIVRDRSKVSLCMGCLRITIGTKKENDKLLNFLKELN